MSRVVVTGMGVVASNAHGLKAFEAALREGKSGIRFQPKLAELNFGCQVGGVPEGIDSIKSQYFSSDQLVAMSERGLLYAAIAGVDAWTDAGFITPPRTSPVDWDTGAIIGTGVGGADTMGNLVMPLINEGKVRRIGSVAVEQTMSSSISACLGGILGLGGQVTSNSSACATGAEAVANAFFIVREGRAKRMLAGGTEGPSPFIWGSFDSMRVLTRNFNTQPERASRPMSASATGFVPSAGAGIVLVESLESAKARGARIHCEILGAHVNSGGHRAGGSMTASNREGVVRCIQTAIGKAQVRPEEIEIINGHLTATGADASEVHSWIAALECHTAKFPLINSTKSLVGHALGASGGIETVASILQLSRGFVHGSANCEDLHSELEPIAKSVVHLTKEFDAKILAKTSFGFGDVNVCLILKQWQGN